LEATEIIYLVFLGLAVGACSGLLGMGGGIIANPILWVIFQSKGVPVNHIVPLTSGTMLAIIFFNTPASILGHHKNKNISWKLVPPLAIFSVIGAALGSECAPLLQATVLMVGFALLQIAAGVRILPTWKLINKETDVDELALQAVVILGILSGFISGLFGVGGGSVLVPLLVIFAGMEMIKAVALSVSVMLFTALVGAATYVKNGWGIPELPGETLGYLYIPALLCMVPAGLVSAYFTAIWSKKVNREKLRAVFAIILFLSAAKIIYSLLTN